MATLHTIPKQALRRSLALITLGGSLCMVYVTGIGAPLQTAFFQDLGATDFDFGLLGGVPMIMIFLQFVGAMLANRLSRRKPYFIVAHIASRVIFLPVVLVPLLRPDADRHGVLVLAIVISAISAGLMNTASPMWFSWMADLVPRRILNRYWGVRQQSMFTVWTLSYLAAGLYCYLVKLPVTGAYAVLAGVAVAAGVADILLFTAVKEPEHVRAADQPALEVLREPFRDPDYRRFLLLSCFQNVSLMLPATFITVYLLKGLRLPVWQVTVAICASGVGNALAAGGWGRIADRHGQRPVLQICMFLKPVIMAMLVFTPADRALWILTPGFLVDGIWNAGLVVGANGFMLKLAPRRNRSMFIAAMTGLTGVSGGLAAIAGGALLHALPETPMRFAGHDWSGYHVVFMLGCVLRFASAATLKWMREPRSSPPANVLNEIRGTWPIRFLFFPIGLYQRWTAAGGAQETGQGN